MAERGSEEGKARPEEIAAYIAVMTTEMVRMARKHNLGTLAYLLEVARDGGGGPLRRKGRSREPANRLIRNPAGK